MRVAAFFQSLALCGVCLPLAAAEIPVADFTRHEQYRSVKISPNGEYLAATAIVNGQVVLELVNTVEMHPRALRPREGASHLCRARAQGAASTIGVIGWRAAACGDRARSVESSGDSSR